LLDGGDWGKRYRIFFDEFYGESLHLNADCAYIVKGRDEPFAAYVWRGSAKLSNDNRLDGQSKSEIIVIANRDLELHAGKDGLLLYLLYPFTPVKA